MTKEEMLGRMLVLEVIATTSLGLYLANSRNDPDMSKARDLLDFMRQMITSKSSDLSKSGANAANRYADELLSQALENLPRMRGGS